MDVRLNSDGSYTVRRDDYSRTEKQYNSINDLMIDMMFESTDIIKTPTRDLVGTLYSFWYELHTDIDEETLKHRVYTIDDTKIHKLNTIYSYLFSEYHKMTTIRDNYERFKEFKAFFKNTFNFDIDKFKNDNPAAFI